MYTLATNFLRDVSKCFKLLSVGINPPCEVSWFHNAHEISKEEDDEKYSVESDKSLRTLRVQNCSVEDCGHVWVVARNLYGQDECRAAIKVLREWHDIKY